MLRLPEGTKFTVNAPVVRDRKGEYKDVFEELRADGFTRVRVDGEVRMLEDEIVLDKKFKHTIEVVVDRLVMKPDLRTRLAQSIETAISLAEGLVVIDVVDGEELTFSERFACPEHGVGLQSCNRGSSRSTRRTARAPLPWARRPAGESTPTCSSRTHHALDRRRRARPLVDWRLELLRGRHPGHCRRSGRSTSKSRGAI